MEGGDDFYDDEKGKDFRRSSKREFRDETEKYRGMRVRVD